MRGLGRSRMWSGGVKSSEGGCIRSVGGTVSGEPPSELVERDDSVDGGLGRDLAIVGGGDGPQRTRGQSPPCRRGNKGRGRGMETTGVERNTLSQGS